MALLKHLRARYILILLFYTASAQAYIGPGTGVGTIAVVFGVLGSILLALIAILWYPFKRLISRLRKTEKSDAVDSNSDDS